MVELPLGKQVEAPARYWPEVLVGIPRAEGRRLLDLRAMPLLGWDRWIAWEFAWLNAAGARRVGILDMQVPASSSKIVESKSLKLYLNSCFYRRFASEADVEKDLAAQLSATCGGAVTVRLQPLDAAFASLQPVIPEGRCLDQLADIAELPANLQVQSRSPQARGLYYSHLFRSLCPVTGQPDCATVFIECQGIALDESGLLGYLLSFAEHQGFHENCVERIYCEIWQQCAPQGLAVTARFTRRGGIEINPYRCSDTDLVERNIRLVRQ